MRKNFLKRDLHDRSGRVTLVRTKLVPATPAREAEAPARKAARAVEIRKRVADIFNNYFKDSVSRMIFTLFIGANW